MFDFFKDIIQEASGIDTVKAKKQRDEQKGVDKLSRYIFSPKAKWLILIIGLLYLVFSVLTVSAIWNVPNRIITITKYVILSIIDIIACASLLNGSKKGEIVALISGLVFIVLLYASVLIW